MSETSELVQTFRFAVTLTAASGPRPARPSKLGDGYFAECSGLELEADGAVGPLDATQWQARRQRLQDGDRRPSSAP